MVWMLAGPDPVRATTLIQATACAASRTLTGRTQHHYMRLRFRSWPVTWQFQEDPPVRVRPHVQKLVRPHVQRSGGSIMPCGVLSSNRGEPMF